MSQFGSGNPSPTPAQSTPQRANIPLILVALGLALVAVIANSAYINHIRSQREASKITIYQLAGPVEPGDKLRMKDLTPYSIYETDREHYVDALGAVTEQALSTKLGQEFEKYANTGRYLTYELFTAETSTGAYDLREGMRAHVLPIDRKTTPPILVPNNTVDILAYLQPPNGRSRTYLIKERVRVLAVGDRTAKSQGSGRGFSTVTVEVKPTEARQLSTILRYAPDKAFQLVIRNADDLEWTIPEGAINPQVLNVLGIGNE